MQTTQEAPQAQRLVVVHGATDPLIASTLIYVGLHPVYSSIGASIWAPIDWLLDAERTRDNGPPPIPDATTDYPCDWWNKS